MGGLKASDPDAPAHVLNRLGALVARGVWDVVALVGAAAISAGGWIFHPGIGLILLGVALILIATRGASAATGT